MTPLFLSVSLITVVNTMIVALFYYVPMWDPIGNIDRIKLRVVIQDRAPSGNVGLLFKDTFLQNDQLKNVLDWELIDDREKLYYNEDNLYDDISNQKIWGALLFRADFTALLSNAVQNPSSPEYKNAVDYFYDEGNHYTSSGVIKTAIRTVFKVFNDKVRENVFEMVNKLRVSNPENYNVPFLNPVFATPVPLNLRTLHSIPKMGNFLSSFLPLVAVWMSVLIILVLAHVFLGSKLLKHIQFQRIWLFVIVLAIVSSVVSLPLYLSQLR